MCAGECGFQKHAEDALELELQAIVSYLAWLLGTELGSSAKAVCAFNHHITLQHQEMKILNQ